MDAGTIKMKNHENEGVGKVKRFGAVATDKKRIFSDIKNRALVPGVAGNEAIQKDLKETKLQNVLRSTKARVDSHWKKLPLNNKGTAAAAPSSEAVPKILTRSNSLRSGTAISTSTLQRNVSQGKIKPVIAKVVDNKQQPSKNVVGTQNNAKEQAKASNLKREDSNLSRKSLTKLKAAINRDNAKQAVVKSTSAAVAVPTKKPEVKLAAKKVESKHSDKKTDSDPIIQNPLSQYAIVSNKSYTPPFLPGVEDIDADDFGQLVLLPEYVNDIYDYLFSLEVEQPIREKHLESQEQVHPKMRAVLIDWINEVHLQFKLVAETYQITVGIIDRYLQIVKDTKRSQLQLVGITALFIAAKYEELFPPPVKDFVYITDDTYTVEQILQMEMQMFRTLNCNLSRPYALQFLRRFSKAANSEDCHHNLAKYLIELATIEYTLAHIKPSQIAAASLFLALHIFKDDAYVPSGFNDKLWTPTLEFYSRYNAKELRPIAKQLAALARSAPSAKLKAVYNKYQSSRFHNISITAELTGALIDSIICSEE